MIADTGRRDRALDRSAETGRRTGPLSGFRVGRRRATLPAMGADTRAELLRFDPGLPVERASTPPASWYRWPQFHALEQARVFGQDWIAAALLCELSLPGAQVAASVAGLPLLLVRDGTGTLRAFHNACRHHATTLVTDRCRADVIRCGYHGWTYDLAGALRQAPHMAGVLDFDPADHGLRPVACAEALGLAFVHLGHSPAALPAELLALAARVAASGSEQLVFAERRRYPMACNWKVFVDNYLDGGYHVAHLHPDLAGLLDLDSYRTEVHGRVSVQSCGAAPGSHRIGGQALYAFVHPNLMINRYGGVLDVNRVVPTGPESCEVIIDWAFERDADPSQVAACLTDSERVQQEDIAICEAVQRGLASPAYDRGRYAPRLEHGAHAFHRLLFQQLKAEG